MGARTSGCQPGLQTLPAVLLICANQSVPLDEIVDLVREGTPPAAREGTVRAVFELVPDEADYRRAEWASACPRLG